MNKFTHTLLVVGVAQAGYNGLMCDTAETSSGSWSFDDFAEMANLESDCTAAAEAQMGANASLFDFCVEHFSSSVTMVQHCKMWSISADSRDIRVATPPGDEVYYTTYMYQAGV